MTVMITPSDIIKMIVLALIVLALIIAWIVSTIRWFKRRTDENWCDHDYRIKNTGTAGKHWYRCTKCGKDELI